MSRSVRRLSHWSAKCDDKPKKMQRFSRVWTMHMGPQRCVRVSFLVANAKALSTSPPSQLESFVTQFTDCCWPQRHKVSRVQGASDLERGGGREGPAVPCQQKRHKLSFTPTLTPARPPNARLKVTATMTEGAFSIGHRRCAGSSLRNFFTTRDNSRKSPR